nr:hypothetical protein HK105_005940 [Polyrhizophydium stewartii]
MDHIKIVLQGNVYGPLRAPTTIKTLCVALKVSPRAMPTLQSLDREPKIVIVDMDAGVESGLYELLAQPGVEFDSELDDSMLLPAPKALRSVRALRTPAATEESRESAEPVASQPLERMPLSRSEMDACVNAMMHLISSIPPRYIRHNAVLSAQLEHAMLEVDRLQKNLDALVQRIDTAAHDLGFSSKRATLSIEIHVTFVQYRIVHVLYEAWKTMWKRFSPAIRSFNISKIETLHSVEIAEHYLNRLWSWRRILDSDVWCKLTRSMHEQERRADNLEKMPRSLQPPAARAKQIFTDAVLRHNLLKDDELDCLLNELLTIDRLARKPHAAAAGPGSDIIVYPTTFVREAIRREFRINVNSLDSQNVQKTECGNQVGGRFWDLVLQEQASYNSSGVYDDSMSSFFRNVDAKRGQQCITVGKGGTPIRGLRARGIMVDMEEGVVGQIRRSPLGKLFDDNQSIVSTSGSGNNWAVGHHVYGPQYREEILDAVRRQAEFCDSLQSFFMISSAGGGTGSGLGSYVLGMLQDEFPSVYRFVATVTPSPNDDVVTSPYNSALTDSATLMPSGVTKPISVRAKQEAFDTMNNIVANLLLNMTSSMRFEGSMNVDINDIVTNLVPFPRLKFLFSSMTPLYSLTDVRPHSLLSLSNNCCMGQILSLIETRFGKLFRRKQTLSWAYRELRLARRSDPLLDSSDPDGRGLSPTSLLTEQLAQLPAAGPALSSGDLSASLAFGVDGDGANMDTGAGDDTEDPPSSDYDGAESPSTKSWFSADNVRDIALTGIKSIPAVCLAVILNLLDAMSYGIIIFPASDTHVPESAAQSGISMFLASMMIEVVPFLHIICATIEAEMTGAHSHAITATIMVAYAMSTIMTGVVFLLLGIFKLGNLIQFFPRHILVGCIGGIGLFLLFTGIEVTADVKPALSLDYIWAIFEPAALRLWGSSLSVALLLKMIQQFVAHPLLVPAFYLAVPAAFYAIVLALGISLDTLRHERWLFDLPSASETPFWTYFTYIDMSAVDWRAVFATIPTQLALTFFGILHVPINVPALAVSTKQDVDLSWEIVGHGLTNVAAGLMFSPQNYLVYSNSLLYVRSGGDSRVSGVLLALATAALWIKGGAVIGFVPTIVVGSLIFHLGIDLLLESVVHTWFVGMHPLEYATILLIVGIMGGIGFTEGVVAGIVLACVFFGMDLRREVALSHALTHATVAVVMYSRRSIIRDSFSGSQLRSTVHRLYRQQIFLDNCVGAYIQDVFVAHPATKFVLLDFSLINGIDYSALESFQRTKRLISNHNSHLVFCGLGPLYNDVVKSGVFDAADDDDVESDQDGRISRGDFEDALPANVHSFATLNEALEWCENVLLETFYTKSQRTLGGGMCVA